MDAKIVEFKNLDEAAEIIRSIGAENSGMMAGRSIHINIRVKDIPGRLAKRIKLAYNDLGAEAAISAPAYHEEEGVITDMIIMGTVYQHREARRILMDIEELHPWLEALSRVVNESDMVGDDLRRPPD